MLRWLYNTLFARRDVWVLEMIDDNNDGTVSRCRITVYDADEADLVIVEEHVAAMTWEGWEVVSAPRRRHGEEDCG